MTRATKSGSMILKGGAMLTVFGRSSSSNVQLVMWAIHELDVEHQRLDYGHGFASTDTADYLTKNPFGRIPVLEDGPLCMFESAAILRYLAATYGDEKFWPDSPSVRGPLDTWAEWSKNTFTEAVLEIFVYDVRQSPETRNPDDLTRAEETLAPLAHILDSHLASSPWIGGEDFTFADIACGHILYRYFTLPWARPKLPAIADYYNRLQERPAYRDHVMVSYEPLRGSY